MHTHDIHTDSDPDITLDNTRHSIMVGDKPVASVVTHGNVRAPDSVTMAKLYVSPEHRGRGLARRLVNVASDATNGKRLVTRAKAYGDKAMSDEELGKMYAHMGFMPVEGRKALLELMKEARRGMGSMSIMERLVKAALEVDPPKLHGNASKKGKKLSDFDPEQVRKGIKVEMEHTDSPSVAKTITCDHLSESDEQPSHAQYYDNPLFKKDLEKKAMLNLVRLICA